MGKVLVVNAAHCLKCNDTVYSRNEIENAVSCQCGNVMVWGGCEYPGRKVVEPLRFEELSEWEGE